MDIIHTIGRRKTSVARVYTSKGKGEITVNKKKHSEYFTTPSLQYKIMQPFILTNTEGDFDLKITVKGGGSNGQAEAIRLAISRALCKINSEHRAELKPEGLFPPNKTFAPSFLVVSTNSSTSFNLFLVVRGPSWTEGSIPSPIFNFFVFSTNKFTNSSFLFS